MLAIFETAALAAGRAIMDVLKSGPHTSYKADHSPVTEADSRAEAIILAALSSVYPDIPIVAEESASIGRVPEIDGRSFILVDPLDGTREFIGGRDEFTVNIALIEEGVPVMGVVYAPARDVAYSGCRLGAVRLQVASDFSIISREPIVARPVCEPPIAVASRSHNTPATSAYLETANPAETRCIGSSLKFCLLAEGSADLYPRFGRTMEWDTAAGDAVLRAAGGATLQLDGQLLTYGKTGRGGEMDFVNPDFISWGSRKNAQIGVEKPFL